MCFEVNKAMAIMATKARILISNDDGYHAPGIEALYHALKDLGDGTVMAPD